VDIWRIILAQKSEPDHELRRLYQQHAQCVGNHYPGPIVDFTDQFLQTT